MLSWFNYARLFYFIVTAINLAILIWAIYDTNDNAGERYYKTHGYTMCLYNVLVSIVIRSEIVHWLIHEIFVNIGRFSPHSFKHVIVGGLLNMGGIHASCGTMALIWLCYGTYYNWTTLYTSVVVSKVSVAACITLGISILAAFPLVRYMYHNQYEMGHRFFGWAGLALLWVIIFFQYSWNIDINTTTGEVTTYQGSVNAQTMFSNPEIYIVMISTFFVIFPWLDKVKVRVECPSKQIAILKFDGRVPAYRFGRISTSPLFEWHAFAISSYSADAKV